MIQDIYPHIYHNEYTPHEPNPEDIVLHYKDNTVFVKKEEQNISFLKFSEVVSVYPKAKETFIYLFSIDKVSYYLIPELPEALFSDKAPRTPHRRLQLPQSYKPASETFPEE